MMRGGSVASMLLMLLLNESCSPPQGSVEEHYFALWSGCRSSFFGASRGGEESLMVSRAGQCCRAMWRIRRTTIHVVLLQQPTGASVV